MAVEEGGDGARVLAVLAHPHGERLHPAQHEPRVERAGDRAERLLQEARAARRSSGRSSRRSRRRRRSGRRGTSSSSGRRCRRRARAAAAGTAWRTCCRRRRSRPRRGRPPRRPRMSTTFSSGFVGVSIQTSRVRSSTCAARFVADLPRGEVRERVALRLVDLREHAVGAAVDVVDADDALARVDEVHDRRRRADARREGEPVLGALERGEAQLERASASGWRRASSRSPCGRRPPPARTSRSGRSAS